jgi:DNA-binding CsgD family transcriptional regulator
MLARREITMPNQEQRMLSLYTGAFDSENEVYMSPAASSYLANKTPAARHRFYEDMRKRMALQSTQSIWPTEEGDKLVASPLGRASGDSTIGISSIYEFPVPSEGLLASVFGLSPAEARLAQHMARGGSLDEFATNAAIQISTARCHLASIFAKTGTQRQAKLVALLCRLAHLSLVAVLLPLV